VIGTEASFHPAGGWIDASLFLLGAVGVTGLCTPLRNERRERNQQAEGYRFSGVLSRSRTCVTAGA